MEMETAPEMLEVNQRVPPLDAATDVITVAYRENKKYT